MDGQVTDLQLVEVVPGISRRKAASLRAILSKSFSKVQPGKPLFSCLPPAYRGLSGRHAEGAVKALLAVMGSVAVS